MYAQLTHLLIPMGKQEEIREFIKNQYFNHIRGRHGFMMAYLLEAIDDPQVIEIITCWENQQAIENARTTGSLQQTVQLLASYFPGVRIQRQAYKVTVTVDDNA